MEEFLKIGLITKPQGIKGELKVRLLTDDAKRFNQLKKVYIEDKQYSIIGVKNAPLDAVFVSLREVNDRNMAEELRGKFMLVKREEALPLEQDRYFIVDIIGCKLFTENELIGEIIDVTSAKTDYFTAKMVNGKVARFPFLKDMLIKVQVSEKKIIVKGKRFNEVVCYED